MLSVSKNTPFYYITSVTHNRLPIFRTNAFKNVMCEALDAARQSTGFMIFAYVIMLEHLHIITDSKLNQSETLRYINGVSANRILKYLKENGHEKSLKKLRTEEKRRGYKHSVWEHHSNTFEIKTETVLMQKVNYIHYNPVEEDMVERSEDYLYSSARIWKACPLENEPLGMDIGQIKWRER
ncbi:MAG: transposase [Pyrinomonadaceae bacterium]